MPHSSPAETTAIEADGHVSPLHAPLGFTAFVSLLAALMALNALAVDIMLPGLPDIQRAFSLDDPNYAQTVITAYLGGFGLGHLAVGILSDRYGRKPVLLAGLSVYGVAAFACLLAPDMTTLLTARVLMGLGAAAPRVVSVAVVRDCYGGREMARVMSLIMMVFMAMPIVAPSIGQLILLAASWHAVFALLTIYAVVLSVLCSKALPETLPRERRRPIEVQVILAALRSIFGARATVGYALAAGAFLGALFGFINSAQQILGEAMGLGPWFPAVFAATALGIALSSYVNSRIVERLGMRVLSHSATILFLALSLLLLTLETTGVMTPYLFLPLLTLAMLLVGMVFSNFNALAMEPQQHVAGIASSIVGAITILLAAGMGYLIGQGYDGTVRPLVVGFCLSAALALVILLVTERGRLCRPQQ